MYRVNKINYSKSFADGVPQAQNATNENYLKREQLDVLERECFGDTKRHANISESAPHLNGARVFRGDYTGLVFMAMKAAV